MSYVVTVKSTVEISQNFVAFSEYMNFIIKTQISSHQNPTIVVVSILNSHHVVIL